MLVADPTLSKEGAQFYFTCQAGFCSFSLFFFTQNNRGKGGSPRALPYIRHCFITICEGGVLKRDKTNAKGIRKQAVGK